MEKVKFRINRDSEETEGFFRGWGIDAWGGDVGVAHYTAAICQDQEGNVYLVSVERVRFIKSAE